MTSLFFNLDRYSQRNFERTARSLISLVPVTTIQAIVNKSSLVSQPGYLLLGTGIRCSLSMLENKTPEYTTTGKVVRVATYIFDTASHILGLQISIIFALAFIELNPLISTISILFIAHGWKSLSNIVDPRNRPQFAPQPQYYPGRGLGISGRSSADTPRVVTITPDPMDRIRALRNYQDQMRRSRNEGNHIHQRGRAFHEDQFNIRPQDPNRDNLIRQAEIERVIVEPPCPLNELEETIRGFKTLTILGDSEVPNPNSFSDDERAVIQAWFSRLKRTQDYKSREESRRNIAEISLKMLKFTETSEEFREVFLAQMHANNERCGDRSAMSFNELYTAYRTLQIPESAPLAQKLRTLILGAKTLALRSVIAQHLSRTHQLSESVEDYLYYETRLRTVNGRPFLLTALREHLYGINPSLDESFLKSEVNRLYIQHLEGLPLMEKILSEDSAFQERLNLAQDSLQEQLEEILTDSQISEGEKLRRTKALQDEMRNAKIQLMKDFLKSKLSSSTEDRELLAW